MQNLDECLREMCCLGDVEKIKVLVDHGVDINSQNKVNGWTCLHWAAKRSQKCVVSFLLNAGADRSVLSFKGELAADVTDDDEIRRLLVNSEENNDENDSNIPAYSIVKEESSDNVRSTNFVPNYILNPEFPYAESASEFSKRLDLWEVGKRRAVSGSELFNKDPFEGCNRESTKRSKSLDDDNYLVLKVRVADAEEKDFIELELDWTCLNFTSLAGACLKEFNVDKSELKKIRKLPNTIIRNDHDVRRLKQFQEIEIVLKCTGV